MMSLSGSQFDQLHQALLSAFPTVALLRHLVRTKMEQNLNKIAGGTDLSEIVFNLIEWAGAHGRVVELVEKASNKNPGNPELRAFAEAFLNSRTMTSPSITDPITSARPNFPGAITSGPIAFDSAFYVRRTADTALEETIPLKSVYHIVLRGERSGGVTSLLNYGHEIAKGLGMCVVRTDLNDISADYFGSLDSFWEALCWYLANSLEIETVSSDFWKAGVPASINMERFLGKELFDKIQEPILWIISDTDRLFFHRVGTQNRLLAYEVFALFRTWFERSQRDRMGRWSRLNLMLSSTLDPAHFIADGYQSPYNVAKVIHLDDFRKEEIDELNRRYRSPLRTEQEIEQFYRLFGGIPALSQLGLKFMAEQGIPYDQLEQLALNQLAPFDEYLNTLFTPLVNDPTTAVAARAIANGRPCPLNNTFYRLRSLGIVHGSTHKDARIRCEFYRKFISAHLA